MLKRVTSIVFLNDAIEGITAPVAHELRHLDFVLIAVVTFNISFFFSVLVIGRKSAQHWTTVRRQSGQRRRRRWRVVRRNVLFVAAGRPGR